MSKRNNQKQLWADIEFVERLEDIRAKRRLVGKPINNIGELTKEIVNCRAFKELEDEILSLGASGFKKNKMNINIKLDGLFK